MIKTLEKYINWQILLIVFVNLFLANIFYHGIALALYLSSRFDFNLIITILVLCIIFPMQRFIWLPVLYSALEKYSKNELVQKLIYNLKNNSKFRWKTLFIVELPWICYYIYLIMYKIISGLSTYARYDSTGFLNTINWNLYWYSLNSYLSQILFVALILIVFFNMSGSYLVLFLWWKIRGELK